MSNFEISNELNVEENKDEKQELPNSSFAKEQEDQFENKSGIADKLDENSDNFNGSQLPVVNGSSSFKPDNSTTINDNPSNINYQRSFGSGNEGSGSGSDDIDENNEEDEEEEDSIKSNVPKAPPRVPNEDTLEYYAKLRKYYAETKKEYIDPEFPCDPNLFCSEEENPNGDFEIEFERPHIEDDGIDFFTVEPHLNSNYNIEHEFKINRGIMNDRFFVGALLMLFQKKEEYFTNLVLDLEHVNENIRAGFCGFQFFINGEWKEVTVDTQLPAQGTGEYSLTKSLNPKSPFWISLFEKAYAKLFGNYSVLNSQLLKDFLVDFTGGYSKMIKIPKTIEDKTKKFYFDEITRCLAQGYLIGCLKYDESKISEELNESLSEKEEAEDEQIVSNTIYTVLDIQEYENLKLIFLCNHWDKGKFTHAYGPEDETWEANKALTEKLKYTVSTTDGTFWMLFDEFITSFTTIYYCRIFPETWANYTISGHWANQSSGGAPQKTTPWFPEQYIPKNLQATLEKSPGGLNLSPLKKTILNKTKKSTMSIGMSSTISNKKTVVKKNEEVSPPKVVVDNSSNKKPEEKEIIQCDFKRTVITDTEESFFLNPQYKIEVKQGNKLIISLMQKDKKTEGNQYFKCNFMIVYCKGKHSRVWDLKESNVIKKALSEKDDGLRREIVMLLDYNEIINRFNHQNSKKISKNDRLFVNLIPYMEYTEKYEIEKKGNQRIFKPYRPELDYWIRIFCNEDLYVNELKMPEHTIISGSWILGCSTGGPRFSIKKKKYAENPRWPLNPQYLVGFESNTKCKIILRKTTGHFANEESKVGLLITKPTYYNEDQEKLQQNEIEKHQNLNQEQIKLSQIQRCIKSTDKILINKKIIFDEIYPKLSINDSELVYESSYNNNYAASVQVNFSRLDSPLIFIPTLNDKTSAFEYELSIHSTKPVSIYPLYNDSCKCLYGEWIEGNAGGSHLNQEDIMTKKIDIFNNQISYLDNPKYLLQFNSKDWIMNLEFEVTLVRMSSVWKRRLSQSMINSMMSVYIFKYERDGKWKKNCVNMEKIDFMPKNFVKMSYKEEKADPKGYVLMPVTYNKGVFGPFIIMVKCKEKFTLTEIKANETF